MHSDFETDQPPTIGEIDHTPRYAPEYTLVRDDRGFRTAKVQEVVIHPSGMAPSPCPIRKDLTVVELKTLFGSRWWGVEKAWINSELRCVVSGIDPRNELLRNWTVCRVE